MSLKFLPGSVLALGRGSVCAAPCKQSVWPGIQPSGAKRFIGSGARRIAKECSACPRLHPVSHGPINAIEQELLKARVFPNIGLMAQGSVENAPLPIHPRPG